LGGIVGGAIQGVVSGIQGIIGALGKVIETAKAAGAAIANIAGFGAGPESAAPSYDAMGNAIPGRATGGSVRAGQQYWVGEKGIPELFTPKEDGRITPMKDLPKGAGVGSSAAPGRRSASGGSSVFAPQFHIGKVVGVEDLDAKLAQFRADMMRDYEQHIAGSYADSEIA
jgi:SLT domain-containing protein